MYSGRTKAPEGVAALIARSREAKVARTVESEGAGKRPEMTEARAGCVERSREKTSSRAGLSSEAGGSGKVGSVGCHIGDSSFCKTYRVLCQDLRRLVNRSSLLRTDPRRPSRLRRELRLGRASSWRNAGVGSCVRSWVRRRPSRLRCRVTDCAVGGDNHSGLLRLRRRRRHAASEGRTETRGGWDRLQRPIRGCEGCLQAWLRGRGARERAPERDDAADERDDDWTATSILRPCSPVRRSRIQRRWLRSFRCPSRACRADFRARRRMRPGAKSAARAPAATTAAAPARAADATDSQTLRCRTCSPSARAESRMDEPEQASRPTLENGDRRSTRPRTSRTYGNL